MRLIPKLNLKQGQFGRFALAVIYSFIVSGSIALVSQNAYGFNNPKQLYIGIIFSLAVNVLAIIKALFHFEVPGLSEPINNYKITKNDYLVIAILALALLVTIMISPMAQNADEYLVYFYGYMVPSTGYLKKFELKYYLPGFILRYPTKSSPTEIPRFQEQRKLARIFYEFEKWGKIMEIEDVGALNLQIAAGRSGELIRIAEALHEKKIGQIADQILADRERIKLILIAGPSSSGKTTFAQRLAVQLKVNGLKPVPISIDDYFVDRHHTPIGPDGLPDFECLDREQAPRPQRCKHPKCLRGAFRPSRRPTAQARLYSCIKAPRRHRQASKPQP
jgi:hypothetical protein